MVSSKGMKVIIMFSMLSRAAPHVRPVVSEFGSAFFELLGNTAKVGTAMGVVAGSTLAPVMTLKELENIDPLTPTPEMATRALAVAANTIGAGAAIGFFVGTAPVSLPVKYAIDHYLDSNKPK